MTKLDFPDTPSTGQQYGSSGTVWRWDGTRWGSTAGASGARGRVAYAQIVASQAGVGTTAVDLAGLSVTWTADPSRVYRTTLVSNTYNPSGAVTSGFITSISDGAGTPKASQSEFLPGNQYGCKIVIPLVETGLSGSITRKATARMNGGTGSLTFTAAPSDPSFIMVEDITYEAGSSGATPTEYAKLPKGKVAFVAGFGGGPVSARTQVAELTFTAEAGRLYRLTGQVLMWTNVASARGMLEIHHYNVRTLTQAVQSVLQAGGGNDTTVRGEAVESFPAGSTRVNLTIAAATSGGPAVGITTAAVVPTFFMVEDIGMA